MWIPHRGIMTWITSKQKHCPMELRGAIVGQHLAGRTYDEISQSLKVSIKTVKRWVNRQRNEKHLNRRKQPGQKRKLDAAQRAELVKRINDAPFQNAAIVGREYGVNKNTIKKVWNDSGVKHRIAAKKPKLTPAQEEDRMGYALENLTRDWSNVIFSDEKTFVSDRHQRLHLYRPDNMRYNKRFIHETQRSGRISTGVWGWISKDGAGEMATIPGRFKSTGYIEILDEVLMPTVDISYGRFDEMIFMQDNCSIHTSKICKKWFANHPEMTLLVAPSNSPDLNPIEHVWSEITRDWKSIHPRTIENLQNQIQRNWELLRLRPEYFKNLYESMPRRLNAVIDANGGPTKY
ncbi:Transposable element Tcb1 transposase [Pseudolycoriella hygida]|uniref:Transposable element Tcb1 transposase n=1 Tax=Pseudolycoriella hygida TaxID=35572 RepID=A0A9Q0S901_9DIPT|nr:Transposable element Tcb1 transposase [Pseudolycoriella hygida]